MRRKRDRVKTEELLAMFPLGGTAYLALEIAWRGTTHWTMFFAGGLCLCALDELDRVPLPLAARAALGAVSVSAVELAVGLICNRVLHQKVWDYSGEWGNVAGLICPKYTALWFALSFWLMAVMDALQRTLPQKRTVKI